MVPHEYTSKYFTGKTDLVKNSSVTQMQKHQLVAKCTNIYTNETTSISWRAVNSTLIFKSYLAIKIRMVQGTSNSSKCFFFYFVHYHF